MPKSQLTLKSLPRLWGGTTAEQKALTKQVYNILNTPRMNGVEKAIALNNLANTRNCQKCLETLQIRQIAALQAAIDVAHLETLKKKLAHQQNLNKILEAMHEGRCSFYKTFVWAQSSRIEKSASDGF